MGSTLEDMAIGNYSTMLAEEIDPNILILLVQVGITLLYVKDMEREKLDIIFGEVDVTRVSRKWGRMDMTKS